jgi:hypothetical protein
MTREEVAHWLDKWVSENLDEDKSDVNLKDLVDCIEGLKVLNSKQLLKHVTQVCKTQKDFNSNWGMKPNNALGWSLYIDLRNLLGAGKFWHFRSFMWRIFHKCTHTRTLTLTLICSFVGKLSSFVKRGY